MAHFSFIVTIDVPCELCGTCFSYEQKITEADTQKTVDQQLKERVSKRLSRWENGDLGDLSVKRCPQCGYVQSWMVDSAKNEDLSAIGCWGSLLIAIILFGISAYYAYLFMFQTPWYGLLLFSGVIFIVSFIGIMMLGGKLYNPNWRMRHNKPVKIKQPTVWVRAVDELTNPSGIMFDIYGEQIVWASIDDKQPSAVCQTLLDAPWSQLPTLVEKIGNDKDLLDHTIEKLFLVLEDTSGLEQDFDDYSETYYYWDNRISERRRVGHVLSLIGQPAVGHLIEVLVRYIRLSKPNNVSIGIAKIATVALGEIGGNAIQATPALIEVQESKSGSIASEAMRALNKIHGTNFHNLEESLVWWDKAELVDGFSETDQEPIRE